MSILQSLGNSNEVQPKQKSINLMARGVNNPKAEALLKESLIIKAMYRFYSIPEISEKTSVSRSTIYFRLKNMGALRSRAEGVRMAASKGRLSANLGVKRVFSKAWKSNIKSSAIARGETYAKGTSLKPNGYVEITRGPNKGKSEHRSKMEAHIGRKLLTSEHVHHKDKNRSNNELSNLELMTASDHAKHHALENVLARNRDELGRFS